MGAPAVAESPVTVAEIGHNGGYGNTDDLGADWTIEHWPLATGVTQEVEQANIDDQRDESHCSELGYLAKERRKLLLKTMDQANESVR